MTSRERVLKTLNFEKVDRLPVHGDAPNKAVQEYFGGERLTEENKHFPEKMRTRCSPLGSELFRRPISGKFSHVARIQKCPFPSPSRKFEAGIRQCPYSPWRDQSILEGVRLGFHNGNKNAEGLRIFHHKTGWFHERSVNNQ